MQTSGHDAQWQQQFYAVRERPEVMEAHRLAGEVDYLLRVRRGQGLRRLLSKPDYRVKIFKVTALLSMEEIVLHRTCAANRATP